MRIKPLPVFPESLWPDPPLPEGQLRDVSEPSEYRLVLWALALEGGDSSSLLARNLRFRIDLKIMQAFGEALLNTFRWITEVPTGRTVTLHP